MNEKKRRWLIVALIIVVIGIGGKMYMDKRAKDMAELHEIQTDLANYLYNNYKIYTSDQKKVDEIDKAYEAANKEWTNLEYLEKLKTARVYSDINKIEFTGFYVGPMKGLVVEFVINDVYPDETTLDTISYETGKWIYSFDSGNTRNNYVLDEKEKSTNFSLPENSVIYYEGGIK